MLSKVYRGYIIEDVNGQWYIRNAPTWTNMNGFSPGPHGGWTVATHQVDKLIEYINRSQEKPKEQVQVHKRNDEYEDYSYGEGSTEMSPFGKFVFTIMIAHFIIWMLLAKW